MPRPNRLSRLLLCAALAAVGMAATAQAQNSQGARVRIEGSQAQRETGQARRQAPAPHHRRDAQRALAESVRRAERATRGQVLSAERVQYDGRDLNRVKLVDDRGRVRVYWDDPAEGSGSEPRTRDDDDRSD